MTAAPLALQGLRLGPRGLLPEASSEHACSQSQQLSSLCARCKSCSLAPLALQGANKKHPSLHLSPKLLRDRQGSGRWTAGPGLGVGHQGLGERGSELELAHAGAFQMGRGARARKDPKASIDFSFFHLTMELRMCWGPCSISDAPPHCLLSAPPTGSREGSHLEGSPSVLRLQKG